MTRSPATSSTLASRAVAEEDRPYTVYRARPESLLSRLRGGGDDETTPDRPRPDRGRRDRGRRPITPGRVLKWLALAVVGWILLSLVLFLVSAQLERGKVSGSAGKALSGGGGFPLTSASTILVLGSDQRPKGSKEPGAFAGPSRSDSILLIRAGGGANQRLSIPRDTVVDIPGHGRAKINAAYAIGGPGLAIKTVESYLRIKVDHLVQVSFTNFPKLIDAMGGIDLKTGCIRAEISGGKRNGGQTIRLSRGEHHIDGKTALALSRIRKNDCAPAENDLSRARRQQQIFAAMKSRVTSPGIFFRLPLVSWNAPKALKTDMGGVSLLGLLGALATSGSPRPRILRPYTGVRLPDGGDGLLVSPGEKRAAVRRFEKG